MNTKTIIIGLLIIALVGLTACSSPITVPNNNNGNVAVANGLNGSQTLKKFSSVDEMKTFLSSQESSTTNVARGGVTMDALSLTKTAAAETAVGAPSAPTAQGFATTDSGSAGSGAVDYSHTNVQVNNVDEADFVKNDDKYIYMIADNKLVIIDGYNGKDSKIISQTDIATQNYTNYYGAPTVRDIFLNGDKVVVFVDTYERSFYFEKYNIQPIESAKQNTVAYEYDVSDRSKPKLVTQYTISGTYFDSRMIKNIIYVVTQESLYNIQYYDGPMVAYAKTVLRPSIYYFDNPEQSYQMNTVTSINLKDDSVVDSKSFMLGYGNTLMVSENNIYIAYQKQRYWCWGWRCAAQDTDNRERFMTVVVPLLEGDIKDKVTQITSQGLSQDEEWSQISTEFSKFYADLKDSTSMQNTYEDMFGKIEDALNEYDAKKALEDSKTIIHKISISDGQIEYQGKGEVDGRLLNQYSMDEFDGNLRVATSVSLWLNKGSVQYNNVYVLGKDMNIIGSLENLAQNETIYSTRFMNDKLYMVTFRQVDPFFVIDLSSPTAPKVLGYLKISGYSSYLHPIDSNHIIGVGKDTGTNEWGGVSTEGVKVTLFDVTDFNNPKEVDTYEIGLAGTDSPILHDPKAFLYSDTKKIMVIPVTEITDNIKTGDYSYRTKIWNGAYVFKVADNGFEVIGKVTHSSSETEYYNWFNTASVTRSLYMDNVLYTISTQFVKANDLGNSLMDLNTIKLPYSENYPTPIMY